MELVATGQWLTAGAGGDFSPDWPLFRWSSQTATRDFNASEILLQVTWMERGTEQSWSVSTIVYDTGTTEGTTTGATSGTTGGAQR